MKRLRILAGIFILAITTLSCGLPGEPASPTGSQPSDADQIGTIVAQTVEAKSLPAATLVLPETEARPAAAETQTPTQPAEQTLRVAYTDGNRSLWFWEEGGDSILLDQSGEVNSSKISPDGKLVMFLRSPDWIRYSLWVVNSDGTNLRELVSQSKFNEILTNPGLIGLSSSNMQNAVAIAPYWLDWIPESHSIAYNTSPRYEGPGLLIHNDLWQVSADSGEINALLVSGDGGNFYYSPDGQQIALVTPEEISLINADLSDRRSSVLQYPAALTYSEYMYYPEPVWFPDSSSLVVNIPPREMMKQPPDPNNIYHIPVDGRQPVLLASVYPIWLGAVYFSPDAVRMAYLTREGPPENNQKALHLAKIDGSDDNIYETGDLTFAGWSPDSRHFFISAPDGTNPRIGVFGGTPTLLAGINSAQNIQWVDQNHFLFIGKSNQDWQLRIGQLDGSSELIEDFGPITDVFWFTSSYSIAE